MAGKRLVVLHSARGRLGRSFVTALQAPAWKRFFQAGETEVWNYVEEYDDALRAMRKTREGDIVLFLGTGKSFQQVAPFLLEKAENAVVYIAVPHSFEEPSFLPEDCHIFKLER